MRRWMLPSSIVALAGLFLAGVVFGGDKAAKSPAEKAARVPSRQGGEGGWA